MGSLSRCPLAERRARLRHTKGRQSHTAWVVDNVLHVVDVWDSEDDMNDWMLTLGPILEDSNMELAGPPEVGEVLQVVRPDGGGASAEPAD